MKGNSAKARKARARKAARARWGKRRSTTARSTTRRKTRKNPSATARRRRSSTATRRRRAAPRAAARRRVRKNPRGVKSRFGGMTLDQLKKQAKSMGLKTSGTKAQVRGRIQSARSRRKTGLQKARGTKRRTKTGIKVSSYKPRKRKSTKRKTSSKRKTTKKKGSRASGLRRARRASAKTRRVKGKHTRSARSVLRRNKGKKTRASRAKRGTARTYLRARGYAQRAKQKRLPKGAAKLARTYGLTRINPTFKGMLKDTWVALPIFGVAGASVLAGLAGGFKIGSMITEKLPAGTPEIIKRNMVPITTLGLTMGAWAALKTSPKTQRWAMPVATGLGAAATVHLLMTSEIGRKLMAWMGVNIRVIPPTASAEAVEQAAANGGEVKGLGAFMTVSRYLGDFVDSSPQNQFGSYPGDTIIDPAGGSWYGRGDMGMGSYVANDFPVHAPGPGDNINVMATLEGLGEGGVIQGNVLGAAYPPGGYDGLGQMHSDYESDVELEETPGGTLVVPMSGGIFGGTSSIG